MGGGIVGFGSARCFVFLDMALVELGGIVELEASRSRRSRLELAEEVEITLEAALEAVARVLIWLAMDLAMTRAAWASG
jgi:hypothetical protein